VLGAGDILDKPNYGVSPDGKYHFKYDFFDDNGNHIVPDSAVAWRAFGAAQEWNAKTSLFVFERATAGEQADFSLIATKDPKHICIETNFVDGKLYYDSTFAGMAQEYPEESQGAMSHEFGHYLGLDEAPTGATPPTVMNQAYNNCADPRMNTKHVQDLDGSRGTSCLSKALDLQKSKYYTGGGDGGYDSGWLWQPPCYRFWTLYDVYELLPDGGRIYITTVAVLDGQICF
jgi:hypothetical protein